MRTVDVENNMAYNISGVVTIIKLSNNHYLLLIMLEEWRCKYWYPHEHTYQKVCLANFVCLFVMCDKNEWNFARMTSFCPSSVDVTDQWKCRVHALIHLSIISQSFSLLFLVRALQIPEHEFMRSWIYVMSLAILTIFCTGRRNRVGKISFVFREFSLLYYIALCILFH
jgi:hypothetical protein